MFYLIKGIKRIITDYVIGSELSKLIHELENKKNILDYDKILEEYDTKTTIYSNQNLVVTYRKTLEDKLLLGIIEPIIESTSESTTEPIIESTSESKTESSTESSTEPSTESLIESKTELSMNKNAKVELSINKININKKKSKYSNKFRKISIQQNKTICFNCGRDTHKQNECTESTDIYGLLLI
jgi:hypothetical protein